MCGRYALTSPPAVIAERFHLLWTPEVEPHYNIAPSQTVPVVRETRQGRALAFLKWGLIPWWAKDAHIGMKLINARGETLAEKPSFRGALKYKRCLILADGFYEWKSQPGTKTKIPHFIFLKSRQPFAFAGLWDE